MSDMDKDIDFDIIESYKKPITIPAKYLEVFSIVYKDFYLLFIKHNFNNFHSMLIYMIKSKTSAQHGLIPWTSPIDI
jgi:hypothetical protein